MTAYKEKLLDVCDQLIENKPTESVVDDINLWLIGLSFSQVKDLGRQAMELANEIEDGSFVANKATTLAIAGLSLLILKEAQIRVEGIK